MSDRSTLHIDGLVLKPGRAAASQAIAGGEIVGLAGLDGHGQETFLKMLAGLEAPSAGEVLIETSTGRTPVTGFRKAVANGIAYLPRDRRATGIFPTQSVLDNFAISTVGKDARMGLISTAERRRRYETFREKLSILAPRPDAAITTLSGGNQQKVLLARALALEPKVLLLNDPTRGVDVATRHVLYDVFRGLAAEGMALVILSSEIEEILVLCHRVLVFSRASSDRRDFRRRHDHRYGHIGDVRAGGVMVLLRASSRLPLSCRADPAAAVLGIVLGFTPTPNPSPQGGGGHAGIPAWRQSSTVLLSMATAKSPSPLWGGVKGGGIRRSNLQRYNKRGRT